MAKRRITEADGLAALRAVLAVPAGDVAAGAPATQNRATAPDRATVATAVRFLLEELAERAPGNSVEMRVPPFGAVQCVTGPKHTRGTPPNVIETDAETWIALAVGRLGWDDAVAGARISASGTRAELVGLLPLLRDSWLV